MEIKMHIRSHGAFQPARMCAVPQFSLKIYLPCIFKAPSAPNERP